MVILFVNEKRSLLFILLISCDPSIDKAYHRCDRVCALKLPSTFFVRKVLELRAYLEKHTAILG